MNEEADKLAFQVAFKSLCEQVGEFCQSKSTDSHKFIALCAMAVSVYSLPFYLRNASELCPKVMAAFGEAEKRFSTKEKTHG